MYFACRRIVKTPSFMGAAVLAFTPVPALADALVLIGSTQNGIQMHALSGTLHTMPPDRDMRNFATVQLRTILQTPGGRRGGTTVERALLSFNCMMQSMTILAYSRVAADGKRSHDWLAADLAVRYETVKYGSMNEVALRYACSGGRVTSIYRPAEPVPPVVEPKEDPKGLEGE